MVAAHVIVTFQTLRECARHGIPVLDYRRLVTIPTASEVRDYIAGKIPAAISDDGLADRVVATRSVVDKSARYDAWGVEGFALELIGLIPSGYRSYF